MMPATHNQLRRGKRHFLLGFLSVSMQALSHMLADGTYALCVNIHYGRFPEKAAACGAAGTIG